VFGDSIRIFGYPEHLSLCVCHPSPPLWSSSVGLRHSDGHCFPRIPLSLCPSMWCCRVQRHYYSSLTPTTFPFFPNSGSALVCLQIERHFPCPFVVLPRSASTCRSGKRRRPRGEPLPIARPAPPSPTPAPLLLVRKSDAAPARAQSEVTPSPSHLPPPQPSDVPERDVAKAARRSPACDEPCPPSPVSHATPAPSASPVPSTGELHHPYPPVPLPKKEQCCFCV
jgi:hypothetical protein